MTENATDTSTLVRSWGVAMSQCTRSSIAWLAAGTKPAMTRSEAQRGRAVRERLRNRGVDAGQRHAKRDVNEQRADSGWPAVHEVRREKHAAAHNAP